MTDPDALRELLGRVEAATGPDRQMDYDLYARLLGKPPSGKVQLPPQYTSSIDAALALVERCLPGALWTVQHLGEGDFAAHVGSPDFNAVMCGSEVLKTPALAVLSALLSALQSKEGKP